MKIRIRNFRSLVDSDFVDIKPITVLVGKNSSGKSTFLRIFPMLKQSVEVKTRAPILLYGNYTDFGSYKDIKPNFEKKILFNDDDVGFSFKISKEELNKAYRRHGNYMSSKFNFHDVMYSLKFEEDRKQLLHIFEMKFEILNNTIRVILDTAKSKVNKIFINRKELTNLPSILRTIEEGELVPKLFYEINDQYLRYISYYFEMNVINQIKNNVHGRTEYNSIKRIFSKISFGSDSEFLSDLKSITSLRSWLNNIDSWTTETEEFIDLKEHFLLFILFEYYCPSINNYLSAFFSNVRYLAPLRATAERYYRIQHLAIDEVDQNGKNLPFFLDSLTESQMESFQSWTSDLFDFKIRIMKIEGHYSIKIVHNDDFEVNLSDTGFGYSQILPILTQLWFSSSKFDRKRNSFIRERNLPKTIVIEQPELHLHPEFQAKFADCMVKAIKKIEKNSNHIKIIIETHSDIIINRIGSCIVDGLLNPDDVNIVVFNKLQENTPTELSFAKFDKEGYLLNWPLGFFQPSF